MIADDRPRSREGLRALLATCPDVEVTGEAANGLEAVHLLEKQLPDVVLLDARMPGMDGLEATRIIKRRWPAVGVVVLTMYGSYRSAAVAAGADAFLIKGCATEELMAAVAAAANRSPKP